MSSDESDEDHNIDSLLEAEAEAAALRRAIAEGSIPGVTLDDIEKEGEDSDDSESEKRNSAEKVNNPKALKIKTNALSRQKNTLAWIETLEMVSGEAINDRLPTVADVHDDLKREVAFYDFALAAVNEARQKFKNEKVPFSRPDDFYAEMVKTDEHMAKVKDRLIFESKKIEAFEKRKTNKEYKLRAKEARANKLMAKAKAKKDHMKAVSDWAKNAAANRVAGRVGEDDDDYLNKMQQPNRKRMAADRKYGHGGKRMRYKQNDKATLNDMGSFNPRGNFAGGQKSSKKSMSGSGANRTGKRARDAARARRK
jgi:rRNA-processing protein EBP2